jgi:hypothetical protein
VTALLHEVASLCSWDTPEDCVAHGLRAKGPALALVFFPANDCGCMHTLRDDQACAQVTEVESIVQLFGWQAPGCNKACQ